LDDGPVTPPVLAAAMKAMIATAANAAPAEEALGAAAGEAGASQADLHLRDRILSLGTMRLPAEQGSGRVWILQDVTQSRRHEQRVSEAHRLETIGQMASGIAHEFNNLLTGILGNAELLSIDPALGDQQRTDAEHIAESAREAAELVSRLAAYAGRQFM